MRSGTSFFDKTVFSKTLARFWPIWAANLVVWLMALPLSALMRLQRDWSRQEINGALESFARNLGDNGVELGLPFAVILGLLAAMAVFSHLYSARSANFMAALPIRREGQFVSCYLAGLTGLIAPNIIAFLLTLLVEVVGDEVWLFPLGYWLLVLCVMEFFFYSFAVCLGQFTGHLLAVPVYYGVFNAIVVAVYFLLEAVMSEFYYGFAGFASFWERLTYWCTPALAFAQMDCNVYWTEGGILVQETEGLSAVAVYAAAAAVLTVCALLLYRRRHMESAGDVVAVKAMRPVFRHGVAVCAGFAFGILSALMLGLGEPGLMVFIVIWGVIGSFAAQMFLDKSFRVFRKWKGAAAVALAFLLLFAVIAFDLTGYEKRIPDADEVESVAISGLGGGVYDSGNHLDEVVTDPAEVQMIIDLHRAAVEMGEMTAQDADWEGGHNEWWNVRFTYTLKNGTVIARKYNLTDWSDRKDTPGSFWYAADRLTGDRDFMWKVYGFDELEALEAQGAKLTEGEFNSEKFTEAGSAYIAEYPERIEFTAEESARLLAAVKADFAAGNIGRSSAVTDYEDVLGTLVLCWRVPAGVTLEAESSAESGSVTSIVTYSYTEPVPYYGREEYTRYLEINVLPRSANTLAVMDEMILPTVIGEGTVTYEVVVGGEAG